MTVDAKVQIGLSGEFLEGTSVTTPAGSDLFREGVVISDPESAGARARILDQAPTGAEFGLAVRQVGEVDANIVTPVEVFATGPLSVNDAKQSGVWGYRAGTQGAVNVPANAKVLHISAIAPMDIPASFTVNGGQTIILPAGQNFSLEPRGNLVAPLVEFVGTASYFIEFVV